MEEVLKLVFKFSSFGSNPAAPITFYGGLHLADGIGSLAYVTGSSLVWGNVFRWFSKASSASLRKDYR
ncbi:hypothetical protein [Haladaptatus sp. NG-WS-4]